MHSRQSIIPRIVSCIALPFVLITLAPLPAVADVRLPAVVNNHMVLQQGQPLPIWGWADPGEDVAVTFAGKTLTTKADGKGNWKVVFPAMKVDGKTHAIKIKGKNTIELEDILIGEVWIGSGQSNMQWGLSGTYGSGQAIAAAKLPKVRLFSVPLVQRAEPAQDVNTRWKVCTPETVPPFSATLFYFGQKLHKDLDVPIGLIGSSWGGSRIEPWTVTEKSSGGMYNGMIAPLQPFAMRGVVWYQGESNVNDGFNYLEKKKRLIAGWRKQWGREFPFYWVQIAPFAGYGAGRLPQLWEAQAAALTIPRTGMAVITDTVDNIRDIHPRNKRDVGHRLARWALARDYGKKEVVYSGPMYKKMKIEGGKIRLYFAHIKGGLAARDGKPLSEFQIAGKDDAFVPATAVIDGKTVVVSSKDVAAPTQVQFGWHNTANPNLINKAGLPASPFRTKDWRGATAEPAIDVTFATEFKAGTDVALTNIDYATSYPISGATLHYRARGTEKYTTEKLTKGKDGYVGKIPAAATKKPVEFYITMKVEGEGVVAYPEEGAKKPEQLTPDVAAPNLTHPPALVDAKNYGVVITWKSAKDDRGVAGYHIYRSASEKPILDGKPYAKLDAGQLQYRDRTPPAGKKIWYGVQPIDIVGRSGKPQLIAVAVPKDQPPVNKLKVSATSGPRAVVVAWHGDLEPDVRQLLVFRSTGKKGAFEKVAVVKAPKETGRWVDAKVKPGNEYRYHVKLTDVGDNISDATDNAIAKAGLFLRRINCGGAKVMDADGVAWEADDGESDLGRWTTETVIKNVPKGLMPIYQSERWTNYGMQYTFDVKPGKYIVTLHLAETNDTFSGKGKRTFDVEINSKKRHAKVDVFAKVGANTAYALPTEITIGKAESLRVILRAVAAGPALKGIEVKEVLGD